MELFEEYCAECIEGDMTNPETTCNRTCPIARRLEKGRTITRNINGGTTPKTGRLFLCIGNTFYEGFFIFVQASSTHRTLCGD